MMSNGAAKRAVRESGFTVNELIMAMGILCLLAVVAIPAFSRWFPDYRLKMAARELYANLQLAKLGAVKENRKWRVVFSPRTSRYVVWSYGPNGEWDGGSGDDRDVKTVDLARYGGGVCFGGGSATRSATRPPGAIPADGVSFNYNIAVFSPRGLANTLGYVYLGNDRQSCFAVGTTTRAGGMVLKQWSGAGWE